MNRRVLVVSSACLLLAAPALAREGVNPGPRVPIDPMGAAIASPAPSATSPAPWSPSPRAARPLRAAAGGNVVLAAAPLAAGAVAIDSTWYDLQDMGSLGSRIVIGPDDRVHVTWQDDFCELGGGCPPNLNAPQPYPSRAMGYAVRDAAGVWSNLGRVVDPLLRGCCVTDLAGGFGAISVTGAGRAAVAQHMNEDGCDLRGDFYLEDAAGGSTWTGYLTPINSPSYLFPQVVANPNGSFTVMGEVPEGGEYVETNEFRVSYLPAPGTRFVCPVGWQCGAWTAVAPAALFRDGKPAFPAIAVSSNGRVGIAVGDFGGNVYLIESSNGSFAPGTVVTRRLTNYTDATVIKTDSTSSEYRPYVNCHVAYNDTTPNVVWSELQARKSGSTVVYADYRSRIMHWDPIRGIEVVKQVAPGEADTYDNVDNGLSGPLPGFNTLSVDWPQVGFSADGAETYVAWLSFRDTQVDPTADMGLPGIVTGVGFGDISASLTRAGQPWSAAQNLTNTPSTDERFFSLAARNPLGRAHVIYQSSATNQAGCAIIGDRGATPGNLLRRIAYLEAPLAGTTVGVGDVSTTHGIALVASPNPMRGRITFSLRGPAPDLHDVVEVYSVSGRRVARLSPTDGRFEWSGRDASGREMPAGVYFARLASAPRAPGVRFVRIP